MDLEQSLMTASPTLFWCFGADVEFLGVALAEEVSGKERKVEQLEELKRMRAVK
jgi:hypothetical protein